MVHFSKVLLLVRQDDENFHSQDCQMNSLTVLKKGPAKDAARSKATAF